MKSDSAECEESDQSLKDGLGHAHQGRREGRAEVKVQNLFQILNHCFD